MSLFCSVKIIFQNIVLAAPGAEESLLKKMEETTSGGWIDPEEIGDVVNFLMSEVSKSITGQTFNVDRGLHLQ